MLNNSHIYHQTQHDLERRGIDGMPLVSYSTPFRPDQSSILVSGVSLNLPKMLQAKDDAVTNLTKGIEYLFKSNKVDYIKGTASFTSPTSLSVSLLDGGSTTVDAKNFVIATGSEVAPFPGGAIQIDEKQIVSSTGALELQEVPGKMVVIGGGIIGLEMGSVWSRLGAEVTVVEFLDTIGGVGIDSEVAYVTSFVPGILHILTCGLQQAVPEDLDQTGAQIHAPDQGLVGRQERRQGNLGC
jgi:dihydrolipoamide dehydrogenase